MIMVTLTVPFQSTLPRRERPQTYRIRALHLYFNPRSHEGSDHPVLLARHEQAISIHTPAKGATASGDGNRNRPEISIHTPAKGATFFLPTSFLAVEFQSTLPQRERHYTTYCNMAAPGISIHAPAKGATRPLTRPSSSARYFNPRSREGSDAECGYPLSYACISIHAPVKGATYSVWADYVRKLISIHTPVKGATPNTPRKFPSFLNFNPRSREGSDPTADPTQLIREVFQSTLP